MDCPPSHVWQPYNSTMAHIAPVNQTWAGSLRWILQCAAQGQGRPQVYHVITCLGFVWSSFISGCIFLFILSRCFTGLTPFHFQDRSRLTLGVMSDSGFRIYGQSSVWQWYRFLGLVFLLATTCPLVSSHVWCASFLLFFLLCCFFPSAFTFSPCRQFKPFLFNASHFPKCLLNAGSFVNLGVQSCSGVQHMQKLLTVLWE